MFENIIEQGAVLQLRDDIICARFAPSMLFFGQAASGKGSAALELARVFSCEESSTPAYGVWKCSCSSCERHRYLQHDDLLMLGNRSFSAEIAACRAAFLRNPAIPSAKILFFRSLRKLQLRFSPVFMEDDHEMTKLASSLQSFDEKLNELWALDVQTCQTASLEKLCTLLVDAALVLEKEGLSANIPIGHIRSASWWCRLAPNGERKTLIIENAENMRDEARNSLLKLLEEPPPAVSIVLTAQRREAIIPTILSRLRQYRFLQRTAASEKEVIRRVFQDTASEKLLENKGSLLNAYLESFVPQSTEKMYPLAAWFLVSLARIAGLSAKKNGKEEIPVFLKRLGEHYAPIAETLKLERAVKSTTVIKTVLLQSSNFENDSFSRFMKICLDMVCCVTRCADNPHFIAYNNIFKKYIGETVTAVDVLNVNINIALEALFYNLKNTVKEG